MPPPGPVSSVGNVNEIVIVAPGSPVRSNRPASEAGSAGEPTVPATTEPKSRSATPAAVSGAKARTPAVTLISVEAVVCAVTGAAVTIARTSSLTAFRPYAPVLSRGIHTHSVVLMQQKFCDPHECDIPSLRRHLEENGFPCYFLEFEVTVPVGQFRIRIEAFLEQIRAEELFEKWKKAKKALKKGKAIEFAELELKKLEKYGGDVLEKTAEILKTQKEHIVNTISRFKKELDEMKKKLNS